MNCNTSRCFLALTLSAFCVGGMTDEVDELVKRLRPPKRFADHKPDFSVTKKTFPFEQRQGPEHLDFFVVKDADRYVAVIPTSGFHSGVIYVQSFRPDTAPTRLKMPTERWHIDTSIGTELRTDAFIPVKESASDATYVFKKGEGTLTLVRRFAGTAKINKWSHRSKTPENIDTTNTFVFRCDPILGYMVEGTYDTRVSPKPRRFEYASAATSGRYSVWPKTETCYRIAYTPTFQEGYFGYHTNLGATRTIRNGGRCRDKGFVSFLNDKTGWSPTTTLAGGDANLVVCTAHTDHDFVVTWPSDSPEDDQGRAHHVVRHRILALPPEITEHVWKAMVIKPDHRTRREVMIRFGRCEDFEDQPLPLTTRQRGLPCGGEITDKVAHSGKKSLTFTGKVVPGTAQLALKPSTTYHLEAWMKVVGLSPEETRAAEARERKRIERLKKRDPSTPAFRGLGPAEAPIVGQYYEWTPHAHEWLGEMKTETLKPGGPWRKVSVDFTTPKWGPFLQITMHAANCRMYVDDFMLVEVP